MRYIVELTADQERRISELMSKNRCRDVHHFIYTAIENQLALEFSTGQEGEAAALGGFSPLGGGPLPAGLQQPPSKIKLVDPPSDSRIPQSPLWGQYYRFLPMKLALRVIANLSEKRIPTVEEAYAAVIGNALAVGSRLREQDKLKGGGRKKPLSAGFCTKEEKSQKRYFVQYVGRLRKKDHMIEGFPGQMKFVNILADDGAPRVGLTRAGFDFAKLENPVLDHNEVSSSLSPQEREYLLGHIEKEIPYEAEHIRVLLSSVQSGASSREDLNRKLTFFYRRFEDAKRPWKSQMIDTMRAGCVSRLEELGLLRVSSEGRASRYWLTPLGSAYLNGALSR